MKGELSLTELKELQELNDNAIKQRLPLQLPDDFTPDIPIEGRLWLYKAGITETVWKEYGIGYSETLRRVVLPVYNKDRRLIWYQCRAVLEGQSPKYIQPSEGRDAILFQSHGTDCTTECNVVEDILSAIRVGKTGTTISLLGTKITTHQANYLSKYSTVTTWLDGDKAGITGAYNVRKALQLLTEVRNIVTEKDPKHYSDKQIKEILCQT